MHLEERTSKGVLYNGRLQLVCGRKLNVSALGSG